MGSDFKELVKDPNISKSKMMKKIDETVSCYNEYVNTVGGMQHAEKWNEYHSLLNSWESLGFNYSFHY